MKTTAAKTRLDWTAIHATLEASAQQSAVADAGARHAERLLDERTRALANDARRAARPTTRVLMLSVGAERYALPLSAAREVVGLTRPAALPGVRGAILGLISWRGEFATVFDLARLADGAPGAERRRAVILTGSEPRLALAVDAVDEAAALDFSTLRPAAELAPKHSALFRGATPEAVLVIDEAALVARLKDELNAL